MIRPITSGEREIYLELCREFYHSPAVLHPVPEAHFARTFDRILAAAPLSGAICWSRTARRRAMPCWR